MKLKERITALISDPNSGIETPEFDLEESLDGKVGGFIISPTFKDKSQIERQNMVWDYLEKSIDSEKIPCIIVLVMVTPDENEKG